MEVIKMSLERHVNRLTLGLAGLALAANLSCEVRPHIETKAKPQPSQTYTKVTPEDVKKYTDRIGLPEQQLDLSKARVLPLHYHKQFSEQDLYHYFRAEYPATKQISFGKYKRRVYQLNHALEGNMVDILKLPDANGNIKVGSRDYFP